MQGDFSAALNIGFGYDTRGLQEYAQSGFTVPADLINGFYITDKINGSVEPLISLTALGRIALGVGFPGVLEGSVGGYLEGSLNLDLNAALGTDYRLYADQIAGALKSNPFQIFSTSGQVSAGFDAEITVPFFGTHSYDPSQVLLDLSPSSFGSAPPSAWTTSSNGGNTGSTPLQIIAVSIADRANIGDTLTVSGGTPNDSSATVTYQWERSQFGNVTGIAGATGSTYQLTQADLGYDIQVVVTATRSSDASTVSAVSNADEPNLASYNSVTNGQLDVTIAGASQPYGFFGDGNGGVIVKAFDQNQDYANVSSLSITGSSTGNNLIVLDQALSTVPTFITKGGIGNLTVYAASNDVITYTGSGTLTVSAATNDIVQGGAGTNYLNGEAGNDGLVGGSGLNIFEAGPNDIITGGSGDNIVSYALSQQSVSLDLSQATPSAQGGDAQGDTFTNIDTIREFEGSNFGDTFKAGSQGVIFAGGTGNDILVGGPGDDVLEGGGGSDTLTGGGGSDTFIFGPQSLASGEASTPAYDTITDYNAASDEIVVSGIVGPAAANGDPASSLVRIVEDPSGGFASLQVNPNGPADPNSWTTIAHLNGLSVGDDVNVLLNGASPVSVPVQVEQLLYLVSAEVNGTPNYQLMIQQAPGADHVLATLGTVNFNGDSRDIPSQYLQIGGQLYFAADIGPYGNELWVSNGTAAGTHLVDDIAPGSGPSYPSDFFAYDGKLVFVAGDGTDGNQVWITDGVSTTMLTDIVGGIGDTPAFENLNGTLYFTATVNPGSGLPPVRHLYQSDGTVAGTSDVIANVAGPAYSQSLSVGGLPDLVGGNLVFPTTDGSNNSHIYTTGKGVTFGTTDVAYTLGTARPSSNPVLLDGVIYFTSGGYEDQTLLVSNGTSFADDLAKNLAYPAVPLLVSLTDGDGNPTRGYNIQNLTPDSQTKELFFTSDNLDLISGTYYQNPTSAIKVTNCG